MSASAFHLPSKASRLAARGAFAATLGIPDGEYTQSVRDAIAMLTLELDLVRGDLRHARQRLEEIEKAADQDHLLPVLNRRAFVRTLTRHIAAIGRYATPAALIYFDLDGFKQVNDNFGHACGDAALRHFAGALLAHTRESDAVGRLGGDEFGVLLCHADLARATAKADRLAAELKASPASWNGLSIPIAFCYGIFELGKDENAESALGRADAQMYEKKRRRKFPLAPQSGW